MLPTMGGQTALNLAKALAEVVLSILMYIQFINWCRPHKTSDSTL